jgi:signal transduction histidine kinase
VSLRARLLLAAAYILTVVVIALEVPLAMNVDQRATREFEAGLLSNAVLLAARINDDVPNVTGAGARSNAALATMATIVRQTARGVRPPARFVVTDAQGALLADSAGQVAVSTPFGTPQRREFGEALSKPGGTIVISHRFSRTLGQDLLLVSVPVVHQHEAIGVVRASEPTGALRSRVHRIWFGLAGIGLAVMVVGLALAWLLATTLARPVRRLAVIAERLGSGELDARAEPGGPREVASLARSFNSMASALAANIAAQRDFLANASHQLRTPLTGLKLRLEAIEGEGGAAADQARKAGAEADRLNALVEGLLLLARTSSAPTAGESVDVARIARSACERWTGPAQAAAKDLRVNVTDGPAAIRAQPADVEHVLDNLVENAIRYTPAGSTIDVTVGRSEGSVSLVVADDGAGIAQVDREHVFERFYRGRAGTAAGLGTGLGLAIVAEAVQRWGGSIELLDRAGPGTTFRVTWPAERTDTEPLRRPAVP